MSFPRYERYKDSGVEWLGEVPEGWKILALKRVASLKSGESITAENIEEDGDYPVFGGNGLRGYTFSFTHDGYYALIGRQGALCGNINYANGKFWASEHAVVVSPIKQVETFWLGELLRTMNLNQYSVSAAQPGLSVEIVNNLCVPFPPLPEQQAIAAFLDCETGKIDALVARQERLIELLKEKRQAVISHAVTKGLNPDAPVKDSGVEWLGEIPSHWEIERSKWLLPESDVRSETGAEDLLSVSHITGVTLRSDKDVNMFMAESLVGYKICKKGDLVINTLWAWMGAMGVALQNGIVSPAYNVYAVINRLDSAWVDLIVKLPTFIQEITRYSKGVWTSRLRLYPEGLYEVFLPVPPLEEQRAITEKVWEQLSKLETLVSEAQQAIFLLKERRSALISAAVTGKIDVRNYGKEVL